jgi:serine/threonine protein phosphatase PrpC
MAEDEFMKQNTHILKDKSGSCAIAIMFVNDLCYVANVGDSRAVMSSNNGNHFSNLSTDHKPEHPGELKRIMDNGGSVYRHN